MFVQEQNLLHAVPIHKNMLMNVFSFKVYQRPIANLCIFYVEFGCIETIHFEMLNIKFVRFL